MSPWTVVGFYSDNAQPFVAHVEAKDPRGAVVQARRENDAADVMTVVEVFAGHQIGTLCNDEIERP